MIAASPLIIFKATTLAIFYPILCCTTAYVVGAFVLRNFMRTDDGRRARVVALAAALATVALLAIVRIVWIPEPGSTHCTCP